MKLLEKKDCAIYKADVILAVYQLVFWSSVPLQLQSIADAHHIGHKGMSRKIQSVEFSDIAQLS